jgi:flagellar biosynthetic protein FliO
VSAPVAAHAGAGDSVTTGALVARAGLSLLAVLAAIAACAWLFRRLSSLSSASPGRQRGSRLSSLARLDLGARREIRLVRAEDRLLVVGVTGDRIELLTDLGSGAPEADSGAAPALRVLRDLTTST